MKLQIYLVRLVVCGCVIAATNVSAQSYEPQSIDFELGRVVQDGCTSCGEGSCGCGDPSSCEFDGCDRGSCDSGSGGLFDGGLFNGGSFSSGDCCEPCGSCDSGCCGGLADGCCLNSDKCLGDPCRVLGNCGNFSMGGWIQMGYHSKNNNILFNNRKNDFQLQQGWVYAEKSIDTSSGYDWGGRVDYLYGTDGPDTQAFGTDPLGWDNGWDNGRDYGQAIPQAYFEAGFGKLSAKVGHFYTLIGHEVVQAPENFFYSHAYTMYNSEPFTHTGAVFKYAMNEDVDLFGGWVFGWDSGFRDNGDAFLGGSSVALTDDIQVTSMTTAGRFGEKAMDERGYMHSFVTTVQLCEDWQYIFQNDFIDTENVNGNTVRDTVGINQYLIHELCDRLSCGARFEWWNVEGDSSKYDFLPVGLNDDIDIYALTLGLNIKPCANCIVRPEYRWDWVDGNQLLGGANQPILENRGNSQQTFAIDSIILF